MADKVIVAATLQVEPGNASANVKGVTKEVNELRSSLKDTGATLNKTGKDIEGTGGSFGKLKSQIGTLPGPLGQAQEGIGKVNTAFKALLANPVGLVILAIVAAFTLLYKIFENTFEGGQKLEQVFAGIKAAAQALFDNLTKVGSAIKNVFTFNFKGAIADIKAVGSAAADAFKQMADLTKQAQQLARDQADNDLEQVERQAKLADLKDKFQDKENVSAAERKKLGQDLLKQSEENAKSDIQLAKQIADNKIAQLSLEKDGDKKNYVEIQKIKADQRRGEIQNSTELKNIRREVNAADREIESEAKERAKAAAERSKEAMDRAREEKKILFALQEEDYKRSLDKVNLDIYNLEQKHEQEQAILKKNHADTLLNELNFRKALNEIIVQNTTTDVIQVTAATAAKIQADDTLRERLIGNSNLVLKVHSDHEEAVRQFAAITAEEKLSLASGALNSIAELVGKQTLVGKIAAIAQTTIDTYQSAVASYKSLAGIPIVGPALGAIAAAAAVASGIASVKKIIAVPVPGGGGGGSAPTGLNFTAPAAPLAPTASSTAVQQEFLNRQGNAANPARVYMVESDGRDTEERISRLNRAARLGG